MNDLKIQTKRYTVVAWGIAFLYLGVLMLIPGNQEILFVMGIGILLLGLNLARFLSKIPTSTWCSQRGHVRCSALC
jgi:hypothetical protein